MQRPRGKRARRAMVLAAALLLGAPLPAPSWGRRAADRGGLDLDAVAALDRMGAFLREQEAFTLRVDTTTDDVLPTGQKVQLTGVSELKVQRPNRLRADVSGDRPPQQMFYDGETFTIYGQRLGYYASFKAPPGLTDTVADAEERYGIDVPAADLFYWGTDRARTGEILGAVDLGPSVVAGAECEHYAYRQADVDWEIWIERSARPLARKLVITSTRERTLPQHVAVLTWDLSPAFDDELFRFATPRTAQRIEFEASDITRSPARRERSAVRGHGRPFHRPGGRAVALGEAVAPTTASLGTVVRSLPASCTSAVVGGSLYERCGDNWYRPRYSGSDVTFLVVRRPL